MVRGWKSPRALIMSLLDQNILNTKQLSWGKIQEEPATNRFDWSFAPILTFDERFARQ